MSQGFLRTVGAIALCGATASAQLGPEVTSWRTNLNGAMGSSPNRAIQAAVGSVPADVRGVFYNGVNVFLSCTTVPSYPVGPFPGNPNVPGDTQAVYRVPRSPMPATTKSDTGLGPIAVFVNGVPAYNALDGRSYFNLGIWNQNAYVVEGPSFDDALGHPSRGQNGGPGLYHHHNMPVALLVQEGETWGNRHSPLIGYAFDGYPIYGPYGYANTNGTGGIVRMRSSFRLRNITVRQVLPNGTQLAPNQYGPVVSTQYPLGYFVEDFEYVPGLGELDEFNGRTTVTPEYPNGTFAYFVSIDANLEPEYPFVLGPQYYGIPSNNRNVTIPRNAVEYLELAQRTGAGCEPLQLDPTGLPTVPSASFSIGLSAGEANGMGVYLVGDGLLPTPSSLFGCPVYLDLAAPVLTIGLVGLDGSGAHDLPLPIPNDPGLIGVHVDLQGAATAGGGTTTSNALTLLLR